MGHTRQQYEDRIRARLGDLNVLQYLPDVQIPLAVEDALITFSKDHPRVRTVLFTGDAIERSFDLATGTDWVNDWSIVVRVEYPTGNFPPTNVETSDYTVDAETAELVFYEIPAAGTNNIKVAYLARWPHPTDDPAIDRIPDVYFPAVCAKAAATMARNKAGEMARRQSSSVAGGLYTADPNPLFEAARLLDKVYTDTVFGRPDSEDTGPLPAMATADVDVFPASIFHRRRDYISDEELGG